MSELQFNRDTKLLISASFQPGNSGTFFYNYFFKLKNINAVYLARKITSAHDLAFSLRVLDIFGCSVSMPLKSSIVGHLDKLSPLAKRTGSVNTIYHHDGLLTGHNADYVGFLQPLKNDFLKLNKIALYGYGSVARTVVVALRDAFPLATINVFGRDQEKVKRFAEEFGLRPALELTNNGLGFDLLINSTPSSVKPSQELLAILAKSGSVYDLVNSVHDTELIRVAKVLRKSTYTGSQMFKYQFLEQFRTYFQDEISESEFDLAATKFNPPARGT